MKDIITKLLDKNPKKRLRNQEGIKEIKKYPFFAILDFNLIKQKKHPAIFILGLANVTDEEYFYEEFTNEDIGMNYIPIKNMYVIKKNQYKFNKLSQ